MPFFRMVLTMVEGEGTIGAGPCASPGAPFPRMVDGGMRLLRGGHLVVDVLGPLVDADRTLDELLDFGGVGG